MFLYYYFQWIKKKKASSFFMYSGINTTVMSGRIIAPFHFAILLDTWLLTLLMTRSFCEGELDASAKASKNFENSINRLNPMKNGASHDSLQCFTLTYFSETQKMLKKSVRYWRLQKSISGQKYCSVELHGVNYSLQMDKTTEGEIMSQCTGILGGKAPTF